MATHTPLLTPDTLLTLSMEGDDYTTEITLGELTAANDMDPEEWWNLVTALLKDGAYTGAGGAAPTWTVRRPA